MAHPTPAAGDVLDHQFPEMRWRALSLAADLDRLQRATGGVPADDPRLVKLRQALQVLLEDADAPDRAERVQLVFSDRTPPPTRS